MLNELIEVVVTEYIRSAIADDQVDALLSTKDFINLFNGLLACYISLYHCCTLDRSHLKEVD